MAPVEAANPQKKYIAYEGDQWGLEYASIAV